MAETSSRRRHCTPGVVVGELADVVLVDERDDTEHLVVRISDGHAEDRLRAGRPLVVGVEPEVTGSTLFHTSDNH